jgi:hypothetical protein
MTAKPTIASMGPDFRSKSSAVVSLTYLWVRATMPVPMA